MPQTQETFESEIKVDSFEFYTVVNGDRIVINHMQLSQEMATCLAWLINHPKGTLLKVEIKLAST